MSVWKPAGIGATVRPAPYWAGPDLAGPCGLHGGRWTRPGGEQSDVASQSAGNSLTDIVVSRTGLGTKHLVGETVTGSDGALLARAHVLSDFPRKIPDKKPSKM